jgi:hypothetical protein
MGTDLLHDAGLSLGESNVSSGFVLDELDLNLASLAASLLIVVVIVISCGSGDTRTLCAAAVAITSRVVDGRTVVELRRISNVGHIELLVFVLDRVG